MSRSEKTKHTPRQADNPDLRLSGSHISLVNRSLDRSCSRPTQVTSPHVFRRPMSAMPELSAYKSRELNQPKSAAWMRPQSADNAITNTNKRSKLAARFQLLHEAALQNQTTTSSSSTTSIEEPRPSPKAKQLALRSSQLLETLLSEPVMRSWAHTEVREMTSSHETTPDDVSEEIDSIKSDDPIDSEISFGTKIQNLAQKNQNGMELQPGLKHKPPLPCNKRTEDIKMNSPKKLPLSTFNGVFSSDDSESADEFINYTIPPPNASKNDDQDGLLSQSTLSLAVSMSEDYRKKFFNTGTNKATKNVSNTEVFPFQTKQDIWVDSAEEIPNVSRRIDVRRTNPRLFSEKPTILPIRKLTSDGNTVLNTEAKEGVDRSQFFSFENSETSLIHEIPYSMREDIDHAASEIKRSSNATELSFQGWLMESGHVSQTKLEVSDTEKQTNLLLEKVRSHQANFEECLSKIDDYKLNRNLMWEHEPPIEEESESLVAYEEEIERKSGVTNMNNQAHETSVILENYLERRNNSYQNDQLNNSYHDQIITLENHCDINQEDIKHSSNEGCLNQIHVPEIKIYAGSDTDSLEDKDVPIQEISVIAEDEEIEDNEDTNVISEIIITAHEENHPKTAENVEENIIFSLDEYDAKLKKDSDFLSLELHTRHEKEPDLVFRSLDANLVKPTEVEKPPMFSSTKNVKKSKSTPKKSTPSESVKSKVAITSLVENKTSGKSKLCKKISTRLPSPDLKCSEEVVSWMSMHQPESKMDYSNVISEKPERDGSTNFKIRKVEEIQHVLSSIPSTYDDIVSILHVLEHNPSSEVVLPSNQYITNITKENEQTDEKIEKNISDILGRDIATSVTLTSSSNYNEILSYLDEVDRSCARTLNSAVLRAQSVKQTTDKTLKGSIPTMESLISLSTLDLAHIILDMHLQLEEKTSSVSLLQDTLSEQRVLSQKSAKQAEIEYKKKMKIHKDEFEAVVKRHQKFIDQLIADKKTLNERCENLVKEMRQQEERHSSILKSADHRHTVELQRAKDMHAAGEKFRREKWLAGKTEKIKEMTVKGLEPELHNMQVRHQQELTDVRALHKQEIEELELRAARKTQQQCEALREQLSSEKEQAITRERELMRERLEKLVETEELNYQEQRRRLASETVRTKQRIEEEFATRIAECESREETAARDRDRAVETARTEYEDRLQAILRRHNNEIKTLKEAMEIERESWQTNFKKEQSLWLDNKEAELREQCRKERDREIELVIDRLENDSNELKKQMEQAAENRVRRLTEKYETELKELEESERITQQRYLEMKTKLMENEDVIVDLRAKIKRLEAHLAEAEETSQKLMSERGKVRELLQEEMQGEVAKLEKEVQTLRSERDREMQQVYTRVKVAVARKDEALSNITQERNTLQERCSYLEQMLEQQRRSYLIKR